jgi:DNA-directed RNA polymerase specialized sigma24 family protein
MRRGCQRTYERRRTDREYLAGDIGDMGGLVDGRIRDERVDVERDVLTAERASFLRRLMKELPSRDRKLLQLLSDDFSYDEIARRLAMPVGSVGPTRMRALRRMRALLERAPAA